CPATPLPSSHPPPPPPQTDPLSLHDALPISAAVAPARVPVGVGRTQHRPPLRGAGDGQCTGRVPELAGQPVAHHRFGGIAGAVRSEEHTSELQSRENLVCRLLLEKKKKQQI